MVFLDFFRKKKQELAVAELERVKLGELESLINTRKTALKAKEESFLSSVDEQISRVTAALDKNIDVLNNINWDKIKTEERVRSIVQDNLSNYIFYIKQLIPELKNLEKKDPSTFLDKINDTFSKFDKKSRMSYQKATFLIGKELAQVKNDARLFFKNLEEIKKSNESFIKDSKTILSVSKKLEELKEIDRIIIKIQENINYSDNGITSLKQKIKEIGEEIENIKQTKEFLEYQQNKKHIENLQTEIEKEIYSLKQKVDLKTLANMYHDLESKMSIVKRYKENFKKNFEKDNGEEILALVRGAKIQNKEIEDCALRIKSKISELSDTKLEKLPTLNLEEQITKTRSRITDTEDQKLREGKKQEKFQASKDQIISSISSELEKINIQIITD